MKKHLATAVISLAVCGAVKAETGLDTLSAESSVAASYGDLDTARSLSGKRIDGGLLKVSDAEAVKIGELVAEQKEELKMSGSKKASLASRVPGVRDVANRVKRSTLADTIRDPSYIVTDIKQGLSKTIKDCRAAGYGPVTTALFTTGSLVKEILLTVVKAGIVVAMAAGMAAALVGYGAALAVKTVALAPFRLARGIDSVIKRISCGK